MHIVLYLAQTNSLLFAHEYKISIRFFFNTFISCSFKKKHNYLQKCNHIK